MTATRSDIGVPPELAWLPVAKCDVDHSYQRTLDTSASKRLVERIATNFSWMRFQAILATPAGDAAEDQRRFLIIDGQHRVAAARHIGIEHVPAVVIANASPADQAAAFVGANRDRVTVSAQAMFYARIAAGDPAAQTVKRLCDAAGVEVVRHNQAASQVPAGKTAAVPALSALVRDRGEAVAGQAIAIVAEAFGRFHGGLRAPFFLAAGTFLAENGSPAGLRLALTRLGMDRLAAAGSGSQGRIAVRQMAAALWQAVGASAPPPARPATQIKPASARPSKGASKPAKPPIEARRQSDQDEIARFLAEKGARHVMGPEQVAEFLRQAGYRAVVREKNEARAGSRGPHYVAHAELDGKPVALERFYAVANELREKAGLQPVLIPDDRARREGAAA